MRAKQRDRSEERNQNHFDRCENRRERVTEEGKGGGAEVKQKYIHKQVTSQQTNVKVTFEKNFTLKNVTFDKMGKK